MNKNKPVLVGIIELSTIGEELLAEMSPGNLNLSNKIGYCTIEVWPDEGQIPHFHIITKNKIKWECCIEIFRPRYFSHGSKQGTLSNKQLKILDDWLRSPYNGNYLRADTIWDAIAGLWELQGNPTKNFINNAKQPDYTKTV